MTSSLFIEPKLLDTHTAEIQTRFFRLHVRLPSVNGKANDSEMLFTMRLSLLRRRTLFKKHYYTTNAPQDRKGADGNDRMDGWTDGRLINVFHLTM